jgi:hypothetical protein
LEGFWTPRLLEAFLWAFRSVRVLFKALSKENKAEMEGETEAGAYQGKEWSMTQRAAAWLPSSCSS